MKTWLISFQLAALFFIFTVRGISAQNQQASDSILATGPIAPIPLVFLQIPRFFTQLLGEASPYSSIQALIDGEGKDSRDEVIVRERGSGKLIYYCNSQDTVNDLVNDGEEAYFTPLDVSSPAGSNSAFHIQFHDSSNRTIQWTFVPSSQEDTSADANGFLARSDDFGFVLMRVSHSLKADPASTFSVGDGQNVASGTGLYATGVLLAKIQPVTEQWNVVSAPDQLLPGQKWVFRDVNTHERVITIRRVEGDQIEANEEDKFGANPPAIEMNLVRTAGHFQLRSLSVDSKSHKLNISFEPQLPLPVQQADDKTVVRFTIGEDDRANVASGSISVIRGMMYEHFTWDFDAPNWAKGIKFETGVIVLNGSEIRSSRKAIR